MKVIFVTRCYKPTNIQRIKDNLKQVFSAQTEHSYIQYLLVDMSYGQSEQSFKCFEDEHTVVLFTYEKKDYYNTFGIDQLINSIKDQQNVWVYFLDDDNFINQNFLTIFNNYQGEDVFVVNSNRLSFNKPLTVGNVVSKIDLCNYIVTLKVKKENNFYKENQLSYASDGRFFENLLKKQYKIKYLNQRVVTKDAMKRPLNVLRKDL